MIWRDVALSTQAENILKEKLFIFGRQNNLFHAQVRPLSLCVIDTIKGHERVSFHILLLPEGILMCSGRIQQQNLFFFLFCLTEANFKHPFLITAPRLLDFSYWQVRLISSNQK